MPGAAGICVCFLGGAITEEQREENEAKVIKKGEERIEGSREQTKLAAVTAVRCLFTLCVIYIAAPEECWAFFCSQTAGGKACGRHRQRERETTLTHTCKHTH